jgi:hypothetical protein
MGRWLCLVFGLVAVGCGDDDGAAVVDGPDGAVDSRPPPDARSDAPPPDARWDAALYGHTITVDGVSSEWLQGAERFDTTTAGYYAWIAWDATNLYLALEGDLAVAPASTWLVACFDQDPGLDTGADHGEVTGTQQPSFPNGFGAEHCVRRRLDGSSQELRTWNGAGWDTSSVTIQGAQAAGFVELGIPRTTFGSSESIGVVALVFDTTTDAERAYAGLYSSSFTDGFHATVPIAYYFASSWVTEIPPADLLNREP